MARVHKMMPHIMPMKRDNQISVSKGGMHYMMSLMGYEVHKPSKSLKKTSYATKYIESVIQNIEAPRKNDPII